MSILCSLALTGLLQVLNGDVVHGEEGRCGSVLWAHVGDGGAVGDGQLSDTGAEKLHELPHNAHLTQVLRAQGESDDVSIMLRAYPKRIKPSLHTSTVNGILVNGLSV